MQPERIAELNEYQDQSNDLEYIFIKYVKDRAVRITSDKSIDNEDNNWLVSVLTFGAKRIIIKTIRIIRVSPHGTHIHFIPAFTQAEQIYRQLELHA